MQNNTQSRDTGQSSNYVAVQVQDNDMNVSSNASQLNNSGPILPSSQGNYNTFHTLQQLQILAACNAAYASHQQQENNRNGGSTNPENLSTITPNPSLTVPPAFMMNFLMAASAMGFNSALGPGMGPPLPLTTLGLAAAAAPGIKKSVSRTPEVFQHCSLRSGKWIEEEEKYAELLIELFEKGHVPNCENGCTLRSLLSLKLHCAKMRVSKKYAGKGIGKLVYNDRSKAAMTPEAKAEHESLLAKLSDAQEKFYKAAVPSPNASTVARDGFVTFPVPQSIPGLLPITSSQNQLSGTPFTAIQPSLPISSQTASFVAPAQGRNGVEKHNSFAVSTTDSSDASNQEAAKALLEESAKLLRQSFLAAFYQSDNVTSNVKDQTDGTCANDDIIRCLSTQQDNPVHFNNQPIPTRMNGSQKPVKPEGMLNYHSTLPNNNVQSERNPEAISEQHQSNSPALTSRSFDELHIFPGSEHISAGNCSNSSNTPKPSQFPDMTKKSTTPGSSMQTANHPLFTAESYAMFAVESAMAASQHDAYLPCSRILPEATNDLQCQHAVLRSNSIDNIDGVVNLLAEQSNQKVQRQSMEREKRWGSHSYGFLTTERLRQGAVSYGEESTDSVSPSREDLGYTATYRGLNIKSAYVSASERSCNPSTETGSSSAVESSRDSTNSENTEASASDGGSSSESVDSCRKARRIREDTTSESDIRVMSRDAKRSRKES